jgi:hypothetical protein
MSKVTRRGSSMKVVMIQSACPKSILSNIC